MQYQPSQFFISEGVSLYGDEALDSQREMVLKEPDSSADEQTLVKPIKEIFICFGQEEFFEGDLGDRSGNFDVLERLLGDEVDATATTYSDDRHMDQILWKRRIQRI